MNWYLKCEKGHMRSSSTEAPPRRRTPTQPNTMNQKVVQKIINSTEGFLDVMVGIHACTKTLHHTLSPPLSHPWSLQCAQDFNRRLREEQDSQYQAALEADQAAEAQHQEATAAAVHAAAAAADAEARLQYATCLPRVKTM